MLVFQQSGTSPVLQGTLGGFYAGQPQRPSHRAGVGVAGLQNVQRRANRVAVGLGKVGEHQLRHRHRIAVVRHQLVTHVRKPPHFKVTLIIAFFRRRVQFSPQNCPKIALGFWVKRSLFFTVKICTIYL